MLLPGPAWLPTVPARGWGERNPTGFGERVAEGASKSASNNGQRNTTTQVQIRKPRGSMFTIQTDCARLPESSRITRCAKTILEVSGEGEC